MSQTFSINSANDMFINSLNNIDMSSNVTALKNIIQNSTQTQLGEVIYFQQYGIPNMQTVFNGVPDIRVWQSFLENKILSISGVTGISKLTITNSNNVLSYSAEITTIYGTVII